MTSLDSKSTAAGAIASFISFACAGQTASFWIPAVQGFQNINLTERFALSIDQE
jgi:hypothetical protein